MMDAPAWLKQIPVDRIKTAAEKLQLPWKLLAAIVMQESGGKVYCQRYEPSWRYFLSPEEFAKRLGQSRATEMQGQSFSYGLTQIMGSVAREHGFTGFLGELFEPDRNLLLGGTHLKKFMIKYPAMEDAIASYNAGSPRREGGRYVNQQYVDSVLNYMRELEGVS